MSEAQTESQFLVDELEARNKALEAQILPLKMIAANEQATFRSETETAESEKSVANLSEPDALVSIKENQIVNRPGFRGGCLV